MYDESSETVFASDCGLLAALASRAHNDVGGGRIFLTQIYRKLMLSMLTTASAGSANCSARSNVAGSQ